MKGGERLGPMDSANFCLRSNMTFFSNDWREKIGHVIVSHNRKQKSLENVET